MAKNKILQNDFRIRKFDETKPENVIQLINHIGEQEKHFNGLETQYRLLASTWLLASLGAMGYLLPKNDVLQGNNWMITGLIGLIGAIGIFLLWLLDVKVYHKLLHCVFLNGIFLEQQYKWLPTIRTDMLISQESGDVTHSTRLYYICSSGLLLIISALSFFLYCDTGSWRILTISGGLCIFFLQVFYMTRSDKSVYADWLYNELKQQREMNKREHLNQPGN